MVHVTLIFNKILKNGKDVLSAISSSKEFKDAIIWFVDVIINSATSVDPIGQINTTSAKHIPT